MLIFLEIPHENGIIFISKGGSSEPYGSIHPWYPPLWKLVMHYKQGNNFI